MKIREVNVVRNKSVYLALGVRPDGSREILGLWIENTEGTKFWTKVFNDLKTRGVADILIAVTDWLKGMAEALAVVYPATTLQVCSGFAPDYYVEFLPDIRGSTSRSRSTTTCAPTRWRRGWRPRKRASPPPDRKHPCGAGFGRP